MESNPIHIRIASHPENLKGVRRMIKDITATTRLSQEDSECIVLAVDEACSNIIKHSYQNDFTREIDLTIKLETNLLTISIIDKGIRFNINSLENRDIHKIKPGGLGVYIIHKVMNIVEYSRTSEGLNKIKMVKKLMD